MRIIQGEDVRIIQGADDGHAQYVYKAVGTWRRACELCSGRIRQCEEDAV